MIDVWLCVLCGALGFILGWFSGYTYRSLGRHQ